MDKNYNLVLKAIKNDKSALEELLKVEQSNIYVTLLYLKKDTNDINDIMQDIFIKVIKNIKNLKNPANFKTWLNQIVINSYFDYLRKSKKRFNTLELDSSDNIVEVEDDKRLNPQEKLLNNELNYVIKTSIQNLPIHYKIPLALREIQGLSYEAISNITNSTIGTVKSRIARARTLVKDNIIKYSKG